MRHGEREGLCLAGGVVHRFHCHSDSVRVRTYCSPVEGNTKDNLRKETHTRRAFYIIFLLEKYGKFFIKNIVENKKIHVDCEYEVRREPEQMVYYGNLSLRRNFTTVSLCSSLLIPHHVSLESTYAHATAVVAAAWSISHS